MLASKLLGLKKNVLVEKMTRVASRSWRTLAVFMRAALESYFMIKGPQNKLTASCLLKLKLKNKQTLKTKQHLMITYLTHFHILIFPPRTPQRSN